MSMRGLVKLNIIVYNKNNWEKIVNMPVIISIKVSNFKTLLEILK